VVNSYHRAYQKRLPENEFYGADAGNGNSLTRDPDHHARALPLATAEAGIRFDIEAADSRFKLDRINVFVNNIPVFGAKRELTSGRWVFNPYKKQIDARPLRGQK